MLRHVSETLVCLKPGVDGETVDVVEENNLFWSWTDYLPLHETSLLATGLRKRIYTNQGFMILTEVLKIFQIGNWFFYHFFVRNNTYSY